MVQSSRLYYYSRHDGYISSLDKIPVLKAFDWPSLRWDNLSVVVRSEHVSNLVCHNNCLTPLAHPAVGPRVSEPVQESLSAGITQRSCRGLRLTILFELMPGNFVMLGLILCDVRAILMNINSGINNSLTVQESFLTSIFIWFVI